MNSENYIDTKYGKLNAPFNVEYYDNGQIGSAMLGEKSIFETQYGQLMPNYSGADVRKKYREAVSFYENGNIKSIYLEEPQMIQTPAGKMEAELLSFYPGGEIKRLFPLYGQISGYWTEEDEYKLAPEVELYLLGRKIKVHPLCVVFYPSGQVRSLTIWRKDTITVQTKYGEIKSNFGVELTEDGALKSIEPTFGTVLATEYGKLYPFNSENYHLQAENNSLVFDDKGELLAATTIKTGLKVAEDGKIRYIHAKKAEDPLTGGLRPFPLALQFEESYIEAEQINGSRERFAKSQVTFE